MLEREHLTVKWPQVTVENELQVAAFYMWYRSITFDAINRCLKT